MRIASLLVKLVGSVVSTVEGVALANIVPYASSWLPLVPFAVHTISMLCSTLDNLWAYSSPYQ